MVTDRQNWYRYVGVPLRGRGEYATEKAAGKFQ